MSCHRRYLSSIYSIIGQCTFYSIQNIYLMGEYMDAKEVDTRIRNLVQEMEDLQDQMDRLGIAKEYNPGEPAVMTSYSDLIRFSILRKRHEIAEFEHANWLTFREVGRLPHHFDQRVLALKEEIKKDEEELKNFE